MIPLIEPLMPSKELLSEYLSVPYSSGIWSNFGELHYMAIEKIKAITKLHPVLVSSGTAGIDLALQGAGELRGKNVAVSDFTHAGSIAPIFRHSASPILIPCSTDDLAMDPASFDVFCRSGMIKAAVIVKPFGYFIDRNFYAETARKYGVHVVFDYCGSWGDFDFDDEFPTVYSFHATKSLPIGEGGVVLYSQNKEAAKARLLTNFSTGPDRIIIDDQGYNYKLSELSCAMICAQLDDRQYPKILQRIEHRKNLCDRYFKAFGGDRYLTISPSLCVIIFNIDPKIFQEKAYKSGFKAQQYYIPLHLMPAYKNLPMFGQPRKTLNRCIALPSDCTLEEADTVIESAKMFLSTD